MTWTQTSTLLLIQIHVRLINRWLCKLWCWQSSLETHPLASGLSCVVASLLFLTSLTLQPIWYKCTAGSQDKQKACGGRKKITHLAVDVLSNQLFPFWNEVITYLPLVRWPWARLEFWPSLQRVSLDHLHTRKMTCIKLVLLGTGSSSTLCKGIH